MAENVENCMSHFGITSHNKGFSFFIYIVVPLLSLDVAFLGQAADFGSVEQDFSERQRRNAARNVIVFVVLCKRP